MRQIVKLCLSPQGTSSWYHFPCPPQLLPRCWVSGWTPRRSQEPRGQMWLTESGLDSCLAPIQNGDIKNPDITSSLFHQKRRVSPCISLQRTNSCQLRSPGGSRKNGGRDLPNWGVGGGVRGPPWDWPLGNHDNPAPGYRVGTRQA